MPYKKAKRIAVDALEKTGFAHIAGRRSAQCDERELFIAQLIRASMMQYAKIVLVTPFLMLNDTQEISFILDACEKLGISEKCIVLDLKTNLKRYQKGGPACHIAE